MILTEEVKGIVGCVTWTEVKKIFYANQREKVQWNAWEQREMRILQQVNGTIQAAVNRGLRGVCLRIVSRLMLWTILEMVPLSLLNNHY